MRKIDILFPFLVGLIVPCSISLTAQDKTLKADAPVTASSRGPISAAFLSGLGGKGNSLKGSSRAEVPGGNR